MLTKQGADILGADGEAITKYLSTNTGQGAIRDRGLRSVENTFHSGFETMLECFHDYPTMEHHGLSISVHTRS